MHGLPIANDLKRDDPTRRILWVAEPAPAEVLRHHPAVDEIVVFQKKRGFAGVARLARDLRGRRCDITLNMQRYLKGTFPALLSGAPVRIGLPRSKTRDGASWFNTHHLAEQPWRHTQDLFLEYRKILGLPVDAPVEWNITFSTAERESQRDFFSRFSGEPVAGVVLATASPAKDWPADRYVALVEALEKHFGYRVLLIGGPHPRETAAAEFVTRSARANVVAGLGDSVRTMMWMVDGVDLLVSPDTGPLHLAHALGTPVVGLFGHTNPWRVGPYRRYHELVIDRYTDPGMSADPSAYPSKPDRMTAISVEEVLEKVTLATKMIRPAEKDGNSDRIS